MSNTASTLQLEIHMKRRLCGFSTTVFDGVSSVDAGGTDDLIGRFQKVKNLSCPYLAKYVEFTHLAYDSSKVALTSEHPRGVPLSNILGELTITEKSAISHSILSAVAYLHSEDIAIGYLSPQNVIVDRIGSSIFVKLVHYGSFHMFGSRLFDNFINIFTLTSERITGIPATKKASDCFALGILLISIAYGVDLHAEYSLTRYWQAITSILLELSTLDTDESLGDNINLLFPLSVVYGPHSGKRFEVEPVVLKAIILLLKVNPKERPPIEAAVKCFGQQPICHFAQFEFPVDIQLHLWKLCGKSIERNLIDSKFIRVSAAIVVLQSGHPISRYLGSNTDTRRSVRTDYKIFVQPDSNFHEANRAAKEYLKHKSSLRYRPVCGEEYERCRSQMTFTSQFERFVAFYEDLHSGQRVLQADAPNVIRSQMWYRSVVHNNFSNYLFHISNESLSTGCKHQLKLDLPRCHQYDESMSSPYVQANITLLIEKVLAINSDTSAYWQGLDSLIASFALLYPNNLEHGFCLAFDVIERFTPGYFTRLNSHSLEEALGLFAKLISFTNSRLGSFLRSNGLAPSTFAVPWLLTCFAHVYAFDKLFRIFDRMINRDASYPLCVGLGALEICAPDLMDSIRGDEAFKVLSNISDIDVERLLKCADALNEAIPGSCMFRKYAEPPSRTPTYPVQYNDEEGEGEELFVPKIHPDDYYAYFDRGDAVLVVGAEGTSRDGRVHFLSNGSVNEAVLNALHRVDPMPHVVGVCSDMPLLSVTIANALTEQGIDRVAVVDIPWWRFQAIHML
uniref:Protein kinase domain-containing protein n=1 Tax=Panagrellus redivivus TaxID=6233 RepID=A0A7E4UPR7_PANRE